MCMKKVSFALVGAAALALAACGGKSEDALENNVQENYENVATENLDAMAANTAETEALGNQADALANEGANAADATDADANAVNAM